MASQRTEFEDFILRMLSLSGLSKPEIYMTSANMSLFVQAFTSAAFDRNFNYEFLEQKGDLSVNKSVVDYCYKKLNLNGESRAVKSISKLKSKYASRQGESEMAEALGFWKFVNAVPEEKRESRKKLLEDIFESFVGALEYIIEKTHEVENVGYSVAYSFVAKVMDDVNAEDFRRYKKVMEEAERKGISRTGALFEEVNDPITKLKELDDNENLNLRVSYHTLYDEVNIGDDGKPVPMRREEEDNCHYYYKVYVMINRERDFRNPREVQIEYDRVFNKVIRKERELLSQERTKKAKKYPFFPNYFPYSATGRDKVTARVREIIDENPLGNWDPARAKLLAAIKTLEVLKERGIEWKYDERPSKGFKPDIRKCKSGSPEEEKED
jgi:dsRNA-specific ribonuclease